MITSKEIREISKKFDIEFYRFKRYQIPSTIVIFDSDYDILYDTLIISLRKTDIYHKISDTKFVLILTHTEKEGALSLILKYTKELESKNYKSVKAGYSDIKPEDEILDDVINRAIASLKLANCDFTRNIIYI